MATHDYVIANGTGAAVRSDLNNALAAIVSNNSSATEPTTTYAYMPWADTTAGVFKIRNGANSGWITLYQLDGEWTTLAIENGTAAAPAIYFKVSGTDTGFYSSGTDAVDIATAGVRRVGISSTGDVTVYGGNTTLNGQGDLRFADSDSSNWVAFQAPSTVSSNVTWTLPATDGTTGQSLTTNGSGTLSWATPSGVQMILATAVASTSGTSIDFTGIPSWVKRVTVMLQGVSTNGSSPIQVQVGKASGVVTTGYVSSQQRSTTSSSSTTGFISADAGGNFSTGLMHGSYVLTNLTGNAWVSTSNLVWDIGTCSTGAGSISAANLGGTLDRIRVTTVNGTDTFDAGTINILYEG